MTLKNALVSAIPPMPDPEDRVAEVRRRARRSRTRLIGGATAGLTVLAVTVGVSTLVKSPPSQSGIGAPKPSDAQIISWGCPASQPEYPWHMHDPAAPPPPAGPMVPEADAVSVTLCIKPVVDEKQVKPTLLTVDVGAFLAELNALPAPTRAEGFACTMVAYPYESLVIGYRDGTSVTVYTERNCGGAWSGDRGRQMGGIIIDRFKRHYEKQLMATVPLESIKDPQCAPTVTQQQLDSRQMWDQAPPRDDLRWRRLQDGDHLPNPLVAVVTCRYQGNGPALNLSGSHTERGDLEQVRGLLNAVEHSPASQCGEGTQVKTADVILVVDRTNAIVEMRVLQSPCAGVMSRQPSPELLAKLKEWLG